MRNLQFHHHRSFDYLPRYYCFSCCRGDFSSQAMLAQHQRQRPACEPREPPLYRERIGIDLIEELRLDRKNAPGTDRIEYWHKIFNTFFPREAERRYVNPCKCL